MLGLSSVFGAAAQLRGYQSDFRTFIVPLGLLQGASFTGAATGVNLARDIEQGWFDRLLLAPTPRPVLLGGLVASAALRSLMPATLLLTVAFALGVDWPGLGGMALSVLLVMALAAAAACWSASVALKFRTQQASPLMQVGTFIAVLFTTSYAPMALLAPWLRAIARLNPVTYVLEGVRQGFVTHVTWADTWPALLASAGLLAGLGALALRGMARTNES
jgi:ABC-2 type transport system permease protein